jgi:hypothetical protein
LALLSHLEGRPEKEQTQRDVRVLILNELVSNLPNPPYTPEDAEVVASRAYEYV